MKTIELQVAKWGNSLAVRLPAAYARRARIRDGDRLEWLEAPDGTLSIKPSQPFDRVAFVKKLTKLHAGMSAGESTVERMRRSDRY
jgi:antitoxin MazE